MCKNWLILGSVPETSHGEGSSPKRASAWWRRLNGSILCRIMGETSDYDRKPLQLHYLFVRSNLEGHLYDDWIFEWRSHLLMTQALNFFFLLHVHTCPSEQYHQTQVLLLQAMTQDTTMGCLSRKMQRLHGGMESLKADGRQGKGLGSELLFSISTWDNTPNKTLA